MIAVFRKVESYSSSRKCRVTVCYTSSIVHREHVLIWCKHPSGHVLPLYTAVQNRCYACCSAHCRWRIALPCFATSCCFALFSPGLGSVGGTLAWFVTNKRMSLLEHDAHLKGRVLDAWEHAIRTGFLVRHYTTVTGFNSRHAVRAGEL